MSFFDDILSWAGISDTSQSDPLLQGISWVSDGFFGGSQSSSQPQSGDWLSGVGSTIDAAKFNDLPDAEQSGGKDFFKDAMAFIKNKENAHILTLGAAFIKGAFTYGDEKRKTRAMEKSADASALNAASQDEKWRTQMANASSIGSTNFGQPIMGTGFKDLAAVRRQRAGGL